MDVVHVGPRPAFDDVQGVAVRVGVLVDPDLLVLEADRIDDQRVALPLADFFAEERRVGVVAVLAAVDRDEAEVAVEVEERDLVGALQHLEGQSAGVVARDAADDAQRLGIDRGGEVVLQRRFAGRRQRQLQARQILRDVAARHGVARALPVAAEIGTSVGHARRRRGLRGLVVHGGQFLAEGRRRRHHGQDSRDNRRADPLMVLHSSLLNRYRAGACVSDPGPPSPADAPETTRPSGIVTRRASIRCEPSRAR